MIAAILANWPTVIALTLAAIGAVAGLLGRSQVKVAKAEAATEREKASSALQRADSAEADAKASQEALDRVAVVQEVRTTVDAAVAILPVGQAEKELRDEFAR